MFSKKKSQKLTSQEELQKTQVLNLQDFETVARIERLTSKKPAIIIATIGLFSISAGIALPYIQLAAEKKDTKVENRKIYTEEVQKKEDVASTTSSPVLTCNGYIGGVNSKITETDEFTFENDALVLTKRTTTVDPAVEGPAGAEEVQAWTNGIQPYLQQLTGYTVTVAPTQQAGLNIITEINYKIADLTLVPELNQNHHATKVNYIAGSARSAIEQDMITKGFTCK